MEEIECQLRMIFFRNFCSLSPTLNSLLLIISWGGMKVVDNVLTTSWGSKMLLWVFFPSYKMGMGVLWGADLQVIFSGMFFGCSPAWHLIGPRSICWDTSSWISVVFVFVVLSLVGGDELFIKILLCFMGLWYMMNIMCGNWIWCYIWIWCWIDPAGSILSLNYNDELHCSLFNINICINIFRFFLIKFTVIHLYLLLSFSFE